MRINFQLPGEGGSGVASHGLFQAGNIGHISQDDFNDINEQMVDSLYHGSEPVPENPPRLIDRRMIFLTTRLPQELGSSFVYCYFP